MTEEILIFAILLYLVATNNFCKLFIDQYGIYLILKKKDYISTPTGITETEKIKIKTLFQFTEQEKPF